MEDYPPPKKRVSQACDSCRSRKAKCDGKLPTCSGCAANPGKCVYSTPKKRRGLPSGYTHDLERKVLVYQALLAHITRDQDRDHEILSTIESILSTDTEISPILSDFDTLQTFWDNSSISQLVDKLIVNHGDSISAAKKSSKGLSSTFKLEIKEEVAVPADPANHQYPKVMAQAQPGQQIERKIDDPFNISSPMYHIKRERTPNFGISDQHHFPIPFDNTFQPFVNGLNGGNGNSSGQHFNFIQDPSLFLKNEIFQFVSDDFDINNKQNNDDTDTWEPIALQYHGLSSLISGFTSKSIYEYNANLSFTLIKPFRVGSIFNISSSAITAAIEKTIKLPVEIFEFPSDITPLIERFFNTFHPWIPMLNRASIMAQVERIRSIQHTNSITSTSTFQASDCNHIALIWAILACCRFTAISKNKPPTTGVSVSIVTEGEKLIHKYANNCIKAMENSPVTSIETIQAMLVLGFFYYQTGDWDRSWVLISSGTRMAVDVRLLTNPADNNEAKENSNAETRSGTRSKNNMDLSVDKTNRERTWAGIYIANTLLSSRMGRYPLITAKDWPIPVIDEDSWEEWESWQSYKSPDTLKLDCARVLLIFNQLLSIISIWNLALTSTLDVSIDTLEDDQDENEIYKIPKPNTTTGKKGSMNVLNGVRNPESHTLAYFRKRLEDWKKGLQTYSRLEEYTSIDKVPPFVAFLHLSYALTWCILCIRLSDLKKSSSNSSPNTIKDQIVDFRDFHYTKLIKLIKSIITKDTIPHLKDFPFMDYFALMAIAFPKMMQFEGGIEEFEKHGKEMKSLLHLASTYTTPFKISCDVYNIIEGTSNPFSRKRKIDNQSESSSSSVKEQLLTELTNSIGFDSSSETKATSAVKLPKISDIITPFMPSASSSFTSSQMKRQTGTPSTARTLSLHSSEKNSPRGLIKRQHIKYERSEEAKTIDAFMLDLDISSSIKKQEDFVTNMGYVKKISLNVPLGQETYGQQVYDQIPKSNQDQLHQQHQLHQHHQQNLIQNQLHIQQQFQPPHQHQPHHQPQHQPQHQQYQQLNQPQHQPHLQRYQQNDQELQQFTPTIDHLHQQSVEHVQIPISLGIQQPLNQSTYGELGFRAHPQQHREREQHILQLHSQMPIPDNSNGAQSAGPLSTSSISGYRYHQFQDPDGLMNNVFVPSNGLYDFLGLTLPK